MPVQIPALPQVRQHLGTLRVPAPRPPAAYGVDEPVPATYLGQLLYPFSRRPA